MLSFLFMPSNPQSCGNRLECSIHNTFAVNNHSGGVNNSIKFVLPNF